MQSEIIKKPLYLNFDNIETSFIHTMKISELIDILDKDFKKRVQLESENSEINSHFLIDYISLFQKFEKLYTICLLELCNTIQKLGLDFFPLVFFKLFQSYQSRYSTYIQYSCDFFLKSKIYGPNEELSKNLNYLKNETTLEDDVKDFVCYLKMSRNLKVPIMKQMSGDKYAKLEKAKFLLEQEGYELESLINEFSKGKDEIQLLLNSSEIVKKLQFSGVNKVLENILASIKNEKSLQSYENLMNIVDKQYEKIFGEENKNKNIIGEITKKIMVRLEINQKKKKNNEVTNIKDIVDSYISCDKYTQTEEKKLSKLESLALERRKQKQMNDEETEEKDKKTIEERFKIEEQKCKDLLFEKSEYLKRIDIKDYKIIKKKDKIKKLRMNIQELQEKLNEFLDKELQMVALIRLKEKDFETKIEHYKEKESNFLEKINNSNSKLEYQEKKIKDLQEDILNLNSLIDIEGYNKQSPLIIIPNSDEKSINDITQNQNLEKETQFSLSIPEKEKINLSLTSIKSPQKPLIALPADRRRTKTITISSKKQSYEANNKKSDFNNNYRRQTTETTTPEVKVIKKKNSAVINLVSNILTINEKKNFEKRKSSSNLEIIKEKDKDDKSIIISTFDNLDVIKPNTKVSDCSISNFKIESNEIQNSDNNTQDIISNKKNYFSHLNKKMKFINLRLLNKIKSLHEKKENLKKNTYDNDFDNELKNENKFLKDIIMNKKINNLLIQKLVSNDKNCGKNIEKILNKFEENKKNPEFFSYLLTYITNKKIPLLHKSQIIQTLDSKKESIYTQTDSINNSLKNLELSKLIENLQNESKNNFNTSSKQSELIDSNKNNDSKKARQDKFIESRRNIEFNTRKSKINQLSLQKLKTEGNNEFDKNVNEGAQTVRNISIKDNSIQLQPIQHDIKEEFQKDQETLIKLFEKIKYIKEKDEENYSKIKYMFKYPFKSISTKFTNNDNLKFDEEIEFDELNFAKFKDLFNHMIKIHKRCGKNCKHLKRFYERIGIMNLDNKFKKEMMIPKNIINKLPTIFH